MRVCDVYLSVCQSIYLCLYVFISPCLFIYLSVNIHVSLYMLKKVRISLCLPYDLETMEEREKSSLFTLSWWHFHVTCDLILVPQKTCCHVFLRSLNEVQLQWFLSIDRYCLIFVFISWILTNYFSRCLSYFYSLDMW